MAIQNRAKKGDNRDLGLLFDVHFVSFALANAGQELQAEFHSLRDLRSRAVHGEIDDDVLRKEQTVTRTQALLTALEKFLETPAAVS